MSDDVSEGIGQHRDLLVSVAEIRTLVRRIDAVLEAHREESAKWRLSDDPLASRFEWTIAGMVHAAQAAELAGDPTLVPTLDALRRRASRWLMMQHHRADPVVRLTAAVEKLLARSDVPKTVLFGLVDHELSAVRMQVAATLDPTEPVERQMLRTLVADPDPDVREAAQTVFATVEAVEWWWGVFEHDPLAGRPPAEAARLRPVLARLVDLLGAGKPASARRAKVLSAVIGSLPDGVVLGVVERRLRVASMLPDDAYAEPLLVDLLCRPRGPAVLATLLTGWRSVPLDTLDPLLLVVTRALQKLPARRRAAVGDALLEIALRPGEEEPSSASLAAQILSHGWRPSDDATALVERFLAATRDGTSSLSAYATARLPLSMRSWHLPLATRRRWLRRWVSTTFALPLDQEEHVKDVIEPLGVRHLRRTVQRVLANDRRTSRLAWAVSVCFERLHPEARDGARAAMAEQLFADPRLRPFVLAHDAWIAHAFVSARQALRAGLLDLQGAAGVLRVIHGFYGGMDPSSDKDEARFEANLRRRVPRGSSTEVPIPVPVPLRGAITGDEWATFRALRRDDAGTDPWAVVAAAATLPAGPWQDADRPFFDRAMRLVYAGNAVVASALVEPLAAKAAVEDLPRFEELFACLAKEEDGAVHWLRWIYDKRTQAQRRLGVVVSPLRHEPRGADSVAEGPVAWMDEPEDR